MRTRLLVLLALAAVAVPLLGGTPAWATVAANTQIINQATLSYNDGVGIRTSTTSVTVTVSLVPSFPTIIQGPPQATSYGGPGTTLTNSFIVRASSNGPDNYNLATAVTASTNTIGPSAAVTSGATVRLGATVTLSGSTQGQIVVPSDGVANGSVNDIQAGDTVFIGTETRVVQSVTDNPTGTSIIVLAAPLTNPAPGAGIIVAEEKTVTVNVVSGTITTVGTDLTVDKNLTATSATDATKTISSGSIRDTYTSGVATLAKYVRNVTQASGTGTPYVYNGVNYYPTGVSGAPGNTLEYILVATNSGAGSVSASVVTDVLPTDFVTLRANAYAAGREVTYVNDLGAVSTLSAAADADAATYDGGTRTLAVNVGTGATNAAGGSIPGGNRSVHVLYQVTINP